MNESKILDQFYTNTNISKKYFDILNEKFNLSNYFLFEPSAGTGSFSDLFHDHSLSVDLSPKKDYIKQMDFFDVNENMFPKDKSVFAIGNPPFGKNSSLALNFLNKCGDYSEYIAFVLPKTFKKTSMHNKVRLDLHLIFEDDLPDFSFVHNEQAYNVPCVFQIWKKEPELKREKIKEKTTSEYFNFCKKDDADFAIRRVGGLSGKVLEDFLNYKEPSHYYIKSSIELILLIKILKECYSEFQEVAKNTAGNPSLSKGELIKIFENKMKNI